MLPALGRFVGILGLITFSICIHEFGHYMAFHNLGVAVDTFAVGLGPEAIGFDWAETRWKICWLPLGGYVQMNSESHAAASLGVHILGELAGIAATLILAYIAVLGLCLLQSKKSLAWRAGCSVRLFLVGFKTVALMMLTALLQPWKWKDSLRSPVGIIHDTVKPQKSPVDQAHDTVKLQKRGASWIVLLATLNLGWAIFNLLPIYPLDGGHIALHLMVLFGREAAISFQLVSVMMLLALFLTVLFNDTVRIFRSPQKPS